MKEKIIQLRLEGKSYNEICNLLNCSKGTVSYHCSKVKSNNSIIEKLSNKIEEPNLTPCEKILLDWLIEENICRNNIADALGVSYSWILKYTKENNIQRNFTPNKSKYHRVKRRRKHLKMLAVAAMGGECSSCGYNKNLSALDFHHINENNKDFQISKASSWKQVKNEIKKCDILCANCHREVHNPDLKIPSR